MTSRSLILFSNKNFFYYLQQTGKQIVDCNQWFNPILQHSFRLSFVFFSCTKLFQMLNERFVGRSFLFAFQTPCSLLTIADNRHQFTIHSNCACVKEEEKEKKSTRKSSVQLGGFLLDAFFFLRLSFLSMRTSDLIEQLIEHCPMLIENTSERNFVEQL